MPRECDWGRACNCSECKPALKDLCERCGKGRGYRVASTYHKDRKGCPYYDFETCCYDCYEKNYGQYEQSYFAVMKQILEEQTGGAPPRENPFKPLSTREQVSGELELLSSFISTKLKAPGTFNISISFYDDENIEQSIELQWQTATEDESFEDWFKRTYLEKLTLDILNYKLPVYCINMKYCVTSSK